MKMLGKSRNAILMTTPIEIVMITPRAAAVIESPLSHRLHIVVAKMMFLGV